MSRRPRSELQFGSDSFLDVVANIVGILIILIVIAGLRLSQSPIHLLRISPDQTSGAAIPMQTVPELEPVPVDDEDSVVASTPAPLWSAPPAPLEPVPPEPPRELVIATEELRGEIDRLEQRSRTIAEKSAAARRAGVEFTEKLSRTQQDIADKERAAALRSREEERQQASLRQLQATREQLERELKTEEEKAPQVEQLRHRVTPLSKVVTGQEQHYRLAGNRVSEVPVAALTSRLRMQVERSKEWLIKQPSHQGEVGPIGGYSMHYQVSRENPSVLEEVRYGQGMFRISVTQWRIEPENDLVAETAAEALQPGSMFYDSLLAADEATSLTFWVYPDSYPLYRKLQQFAHEQGFLVAGRPLPTGIPISGSPTGTKSAGQ